MGQLLPYTELPRLTFCTLTEGTVHLPHQSGALYGYMGDFRRRCGTCFPADLSAALLIQLPFSGGDFTNIFYLLSSFSVDYDASKLEDFLEDLTSQCASVEELKVAFKPQMDPR